MNIKQLSAISNIPVRTLQRYIYVLDIPHIFRKSNISVDALSDHKFFKSIKLMKRFEKRLHILKPIYSFSELASITGYGRKRILRMLGLLPQQKKCKSVPIVYVGKKRYVYLIDLYTFCFLK